MKKIILIVLSIILTLALVAVSFSSCGIISKVENAVTYPDTYSITYEITTAEGLIHTLTKTVDANGNIYFKNIDSEKLFINNGGAYTVYTKSYDGTFTAVDGAKYTREAVEKELELFASYAKQTTNKFIPTARKTGTKTVAGKTADVYKIGVNLLAVSFFHYYYVDQESGVCLGVEAINTVFGNEEKANEESFVCTEYITSNIENLENKITK